MKISHLIAITLVVPVCMITARAEDYTTTTVTEEHHVVHHHHHHYRHHHDDNFGSDVEHTFKGVGGDLEEGFTGDRTVDR